MSTSVTHFLCVVTAVQEGYFWDLSENSIHLCFALLCIWKGGAGMISQGVSCCPILVHGGRDCLENGPAGSQQWSACRACDVHELHQLRVHAGSARRA
jgi:hypothetical protein